MAARAWILVSLSQPKIDYVDDMLLFATSNEEVIWLDVAMEEAILVDKLNSLELFIMYLWLANLQSRS
jgi:hypothetical protein